MAGITKVEEKIRAEISAAGPMTFARFMELALYCPDYGYYEKIEDRDRIGRQGDFFTSVSVGSVFGELLAIHFQQWLRELQPLDAPPVQLLEMGAHDGRLASDILTALQTFAPDLLESLQYLIVEAAHRQRLQSARLSAFRERVLWKPSLEGKFRGIFFCNELLDALPVHSLRWNARERQWYEWGVTAGTANLEWTRLGAWDQGVHGWHAPSASSAATPAESQKLADLLPDGFQTEVCPAATALWHAVAAGLENGYLLAIDYGYESEDFLAPERSRGTLLGYRQHRIQEDVLASPGEQDLTAHVDFGELIRTGQSLGLQTIFFGSQSKFLTAAAEQVFKNPERTWSKAQLRQFQTLIHPEHLGRNFKVLVMAKHIPK